MLSFLAFKELLTALTSTAHIFLLSLDPSDFLWPFVSDNHICFRNLSYYFWAVKLLLVPRIPPLLSPSISHIHGHTHTHNTLKTILASLTLFSISLFWKIWNIQKSWKTSLLNTYLLPRLLTFRHILIPSSLYIYVHIHLYTYIDIHTHTHTNFVQFYISFLAKPWRYVTDVMVLHP